MNSDRRLRSEPPDALPPLDPASRQVQQITRAAFKLDATARRRFLDQQCGDDPSMRQAVEAVLRARAAETEPPAYEVLDMSAPEPPEIPYQNIGPYEILRLIARGGMGTIYEARDRRLQRRVALKIVHGGAAARPDVLKRFELESQTLAHLHHRSIVPIYSSGRTPDGTPYYAMEYVPGESLDEYVRFRELSLANRLHLFLQICDAVFHAHVNGVIHRDLKPSNILVTEDTSSTEARDSTRSNPLVKVVDFGLARVTNPAIGQESALSETRAFLGTIRYMSPEQATGASSNTDARSDVYSLGVILFQLLTDELPYDLQDTLLPSALSIICSQAPIRPSQLDPQLAGDLETILLKALEKDPARRYQSAAALAEDVERFLSGQPIIAHPASAAYQLLKIFERHRALTATVALFLAVMIGLTAWFMLQLKRERNIALRSQTEAIKRADEAERARAAAQEERDRARRLEDAHRLTELLSRAQALWPARPAIVQDLHGWLIEAEDLVSRRGTHEARLNELRNIGTPLPHPADAQRDEQRAAITALEGQLRSNPAADSQGPILRQLTVARERLRDLERTIRAERGYEFADRDDQFVFTTLQELLRGIDILADQNPYGDSIAGVRVRLQFADSVSRISIDEHRLEWRQTIEAIADVRLAPQYGGLEIIEQIGLVPIGQDPDSGLFEFWHVASGSCPPRAADGRLIRSEDTGLVFVLLPAGTFTPGSQREDPERPNYDPYAAADEEPPSTPFRIEPFFFSKFEMTQGQWLRCTGSNPSYLRPSVRGRDAGISLRNPVEHVSWETARRVMGQLGLRLPHESMWEYACRAGTTTAWSCGDDVDALVGHALLRAQSRGEALYTVASHGATGSLLPNAFGLYDMHGNVAEWCHERYAERIRPPSFVSEAEVFGTDSPWRRIDQRRVFRGGSFVSEPHEARSSFRAAAARESQDDAIGVRPVRWLEQ